MAVLYQSLNDAFSFSISPAYLSSWGPSLLSQITFPITDQIKGRLRLDYRARRGAAIGFDSEINYGANKNSYLNLRTYFIDDQNPELNQTSVPRGPIGSARYRVTVEDRTNFTSDIYGIVNITKLSDAFVMEDFYQSEFRINPVPDNVVAITKTNPIYTLTAIARFQANSFFEQTERLPEVVLDVRSYSHFWKSNLLPGRKRDCGPSSQLPERFRLRRLRKLAGRYFSPITFPKHVFWLAQHRPARRLSRDLLQ